MMITNAYLSTIRDEGNIPKFKVSILDIYNHITDVSKFDWAGLLVVAQVQINLLVI